MADPQQPVEQQVTSQTPASKQKNPKRVAASKAIAQKTKQAREAQKKALIEAQSIIANSQAEPVAEPVAEPPPVESTKMATTKWLSVISIIVSLVGVYNKREAIEGVFTKETPRVSPPSPVAPRAPPPSPVDAAPKSGIRKMN